MNKSPSISEEEIQARMAKLRAMRKYRQLDLPESLLRDVIMEEFSRHSNSSEALKAVREKLHNIIAPYLGDPDYPAAQAMLQAVFASENPNAVRQFCLSMLSSHASTRERIPLLENFYKQLWEVTGIPATILDLACGMQPFALPWMELPPATRYFAYDLHRPRVDLINLFFEQSGFSGRAYHEDILVNPPQVEADVALFFKEAHRFEQRRRGACLPFFQALRVQWLLVSLPISSLKGTRNLEDRQRRLMQSILSNQTWHVEEICFENELVFCIHKS
jgi:16S rRNA (guanine(1405)-N(7))-methyltransferase